MKKNLNKFLIFGVFLSFVLGCNVFSKIKQSIDEAQKPQVVTSSDGTHQLTVPGGWQKQPNLNDEATIQAANLIGELYVIVIPESKSTIDESVDLDFATDAIRQSLMTTVSGAVFTDSVPVTINGMPARQFEASGEVEKMKVTYLFAVVDAPQTYYQIITWTLTPRFQSNKGKLQEVINSFKENGVANAPPPTPAAKPTAKRK